MNLYTISRRKFWVIFLMMAVLLFMFQFSQVIKERGNEYDTNSYATGDLPDGTDKWTVKQVSNETVTQEDYVLFVGNEGTDLHDIVMQWCTYTKRNLMSVSDFSGIALPKDKKPCICLIDSKTTDVISRVSDIKRLANQDIVIVFCNLPEVEKLKQSEQLMDMLGIDEVKNLVRIDGVRLFDGFFIGGEAVYKANHKNEQKMQDFDLEIPYYITGKGTKTYMVGLLDEKYTKREKFPRLLWRNTLGGTTIFAVNGNFMDTLTGLGILNAIMYESRDYDLYPIVNAQNVVIANYPTLTSENEEKMIEIYSRNSEIALRDIFWPGILSMSAQNELKMTCYVTPKYDYSNDLKPDASQLVFYLQQMKESKAEAGRSLHKKDTSLKHKIEYENIFLNNGFSNYTFGAVYAKELDDELMTVIKEKKGLESVNTLTSENTSGYPLLSYYTDDVTLLGVTNMAGEYTYNSDFRLRSLVSALGYSNLFIDLHNVIWPESEEDNWENYFDKVHSNVSTYYSNHFLFEKTTMSQADERVREFLNMSFSQMRNENHISIRMKNSNENYFILRTHGETIDSIHGGDFTKMEKDVYLIHTTEKIVDLIVRPSDDIMTYDSPFAGR